MKDHNVISKNWFYCLAMKHITIIIIVIVIKNLYILPLKEENKSEALMLINIIIINP